MTQPALLDQHGRELVNYEARPRSDFRKAPAPILGNAFGDWAGRDLAYLRLPGGGVLQFDLSRLRLADYRTMRMHYQINASMMILMFMMHELDWHIECEVPKIAEQIEGNLRDVWTRLIRGISQAYWAGFSPCVLEFENNTRTSSIELTKIKDLVPEDCTPNWKYEPGWAPPGHTPPKLKSYDGIRHPGSSWPIPPENTLWYPLLMENGDFFGRKLLKPSFPSWFFSQLIHLFANRYYERYGEPLPIGRAPFEDQIQSGPDTTINGREAMENILVNLRNRSVVTLPGDKDSNGNYLYDIQYLESQMRGADFERYMSRLDEEMALSVFTPVLLFRTADVGSYNLGTQHLQLYRWCLGALASDLGEFIQRYPVARLHDMNFGPNAPKAYFRHRSQGKDSDQILNTIVEYTLRAGNAMPDLDELGRAVGMSFNEIENLQAVAPGETVEPASQIDTAEPTVPGSGGDVGPGGVGYRVPERVQATAQLMAGRLKTQIAKAWREGTFGTDRFKPGLGYRKQFEEALVMEGWERTQAHRRADEFYGMLGAVLDNTVGLGRDEFAGPGEVSDIFKRAVVIKCSELAQPERPILG